MIQEQTTLKDLAHLVCSALLQHGISAVLTGGAVVSIYTDNQYESLDLDFITHAGLKQVDIAMALLGFRRTEGRYYHHPASQIIVEFPSPPLAIGNLPIKTYSELKHQLGVLRLLTPTHCVMDRLAAFYHWKDHQALQQALMVARAQMISLKEIESWSEQEGKTEEFRTFAKLLSAK